MTTKLKSNFLHFLYLSQKFIQLFKKRVSVVGNSLSNANFKYI